MCTCTFSMIQQKCIGFCINLTHKWCRFEGPGLLQRLLPHSNLIWPLYTVSWQLQPGWPRCICAGWSCLSFNFKCSSLTTEIKHITTCTKNELDNTEQSDLWSSSQGQDAVVQTHRQKHSGDLTLPLYPSFIRPSLPPSIHPSVLSSIIHPSSLSSAIHASIHPSSLHPLVPPSIIHRSIHPSVHSSSSSLPLFCHPWLHPSPWPFIPSSLHPSFISPSIPLFLHPHIHPSFCPFIPLSLYLSFISPSTHPSVPLLNC